MTVYKKDDIKYEAVNDAQKAAFETSGWAADKSSEESEQEQTSKKK